jgi:hypothetical protein
MGDAIERIAAAIDQLARDAQDARGTAVSNELATRVASLWQLVSDLDPELARRAQRYTTPADGAPSSYSGTIRSGDCEHSTFHSGQAARCGKCCG